MCVPSKSDPSVAPEGYENLFILAPQANGNQPDQHIINQTVDNIIARIERKIGINFASDIVAKEIKAHDYFKAAYNAYSGNAFGLTHTLLQSAPFRPPLKAKKLNGLYFAGQYTNPGTGVPMVVLSGKVVAKVVQAYE
jgi:phytoene desaturase